MLKKLSNIIWNANDFLATNVQKYFSFVQKKLRIFIIFIFEQVERIRLIIRRLWV